MDHATSLFAHEQRRAQSEATRLLNIRTLSDMTRTIMLSKRAIAESRELMAEIDLMIARS
jgi:hypothetical protein